MALGDGTDGLSCQKWTEKKVDPRSNFGRKKWTGGVHFFLPKVDIPCQKWTWSNLVKKKMDLVQFHCQNLSRSIFGRGKKWTRSSFAAKIQAGPFLAGGKKWTRSSFTAEIQQVDFWQGKKVDPVQFRYRNPGRSIFGRGKKWTRSSFAGRSIFGKGKKVDPKSRQIHFWQGKKVDLLPKSRQVHFWQGKKVTRSSFPAEIQAGPFLAGDPVQFRWQVH